MIPDTLVPVLAAIAHDAGFEPAAILAIADVESGGRVFARIDGRNEPLIRFEGHYFDRRLSGAARNAARAAGLAHPVAGKVANPASQAARWAMLARAAEIDAKAAYESCSWGLGQVMGAHWAWLGYAGVEALVAEARAGAEGQLRLMLRFIDKAALAPAIRRRDWPAFARGYNGPAYARNRYHARIARAYARYTGREDPKRPTPAASADTLRRGMHGPAIMELQRSLGALGYPVRADGKFGPLTESAVRRFQHDQALTADGVAGPFTRAAMARAMPLSRFGVTWWERLRTLFWSPFGWLRALVSG